MAEPIATATIEVAELERQKRREKILATALIEILELHGMAGRLSRAHQIAAQALDQHKRELNS
jgi:hypothetical protein